LILLTTIHEKVYKQIAKVFVSASRVLLLHSKECVLKIGISCLLKAFWKVFLKLLYHLIRDLFYSNRGGFLRCACKFIEGRPSYIQGNRSCFSRCNTDVYYGYVASRLNSSRTISYVLVLIFIQHLVFFRLCEYFPD